MSLLLDLKSQLSESLQRRAATTAGRWGENYVILGKPLAGPMRFDHHPWGRIWCDLNEDWIGKKGAQMMMTHACLTRALFTVDILRNDVLYSLPKLSDAADFSKSKFDSLLELSPHLATLFSNVRNVGHKKAGSVNLYLRGSRSRTGYKSISVGLMVFDEYDEMRQANIPLAEERSAGYQEKDTQTIKISTPTVPKHGISKEYLLTTQEHFYFKCPFCSLNGIPRWSELLDLTSIKVCAKSPEDMLGLKNSYLVTSCCNRRLPDDKRHYLSERNCRWFPTAKGAELRGFWIPQLYSMVKPTWKIAKQIIQARSDPIVDQELHNSVLAKEFIAADACVTVEMVASCQDAHENRSSPVSKIVTMGVDVGHKELYVHIDEWLLPQSLGRNLNNHAVCFTRAILTIPAMEYLDALMSQYQVLHAVVDVDPAFRDGIAFANRFPGHVNLCRFARGIKHREINPEEGTNDVVKQVNRTMWLETSQRRYRNGKARGACGIVLPRTLPVDYAEMIAAILRRDSYDEDKNIISKFISNGPDHWGFARVYSEIALPIAVSASENQDVKSFL